MNTAKAAPPQPLAPAELSLSTLPSELPADNATNSAIVVSILDAAAKPTVAITSLNVSLTSSEESVGVVTPRVTIPAGQTYAIANLTTTHTPGTTIITATTTGLTTASTTVTTVVAVGYPTHLVITAVPATVLASAASTGNLILQLEDDTGLPAKAITAIPISLYSSNTNVVNVTTPTTTMQPGEYLKEINYTSGFVPGSAVVTASAAGFSSGIATISVQGSPPLALNLEAQPNVMVACAIGATSCNQTGRLVVALTDLNGNPTRAPKDIKVQIRSSDLPVVSAYETATIEAGNISAIAAYNVTSATGTATITASSPGLQSSFTSVTVTSPSTVSPSICTGGAATTCQLAIYAGPNPVLADHRSYSSVVVALQNPLGVPALNSTGITWVTLTSSLTGVGNFTTVTFPIPEGRNWAAVTFTSTYQVGDTQLTASAQNMLPVQTSLSTYGAVPSRVVVSAISTPLPADGTSHPALELSLEDAQGSPAPAGSVIPVNLTSSQSDIVSVGDTVIPAGGTFAIVNATAGILKGTANVTALVSSLGSGVAGVASSSVDISTVIPAPSALSASAPNGNTIMLAPGASNPLDLMAIQLQDSSGNPARARAPMNLTITSSNSTIISKELSAQIPVGADYASISLAANVPGTTTLTIATPGLSIASVALTFLPYPGTETLSGGPAKIFLNQTAVLAVNVALDGEPLKGVPVDWKASTGGLVIATPPSTTTSTTSTTSTATSTKSTTAAAVTPVPTINDTTSKAGTSVAIFHPTSTGSAVITAIISPGTLLPKTLNFTVQVVPAPVAVHAKPKTSITRELTTFPLMLVPIGAGGGVVAAVFLVRKRGGGKTGDEDFDTSFE